MRVTSAISNGPTSKLVSYYRTREAPCIPRVESKYFQREQTDAARTRDPNRLDAFPVNAYPSCTAHCRERWDSSRSSGVRSSSSNRQQKKLPRRTRPTGVRTVMPGSTHTRGNAPNVGRRRSRRWRRRSEYLSSSNRSESSVVVERSPTLAG